MVNHNHVTLSNLIGLGDSSWNSSETIMENRHTYIQIVIREIITILQNEKRDIYTCVYKEKESSNDYNHISNVNASNQNNMFDYSDISDHDNVSDNNKNNNKKA